MIARVDVGAFRDPSIIVPYSVPEHVRVPPEVLAALLDVAEAARVVALEREGHELGGESPLYVKLVILDECLARLDFGDGA